MGPTEEQKKIELIDQLKSGISVMTNYQHDMDHTSWFDHVGIIISGNQARMILECLEKDTDDGIQETGAMPNLDWIIEKIRSFFKWLQK